MESKNTKWYFKSKRDGFSIKEKKSIVIRENTRSSDFIIPNVAVGCDFYCNYCNISRHQPQGNSVNLYSNLSKIIVKVKDYCEELPPKIANQVDPVYYVGDIGEATDCLGPSIISTTNTLITELINVPNLKLSFASKACCPSRVNKLINSSIPYKVRIRASLMPQKVVDIVEIGTSKIIDRVKGLNLAFAKGYECHINLSPVIIYPGWTTDYIELFKLIDSLLEPEVKKQLGIECIFLTHDHKMHNLNLEWNCEAERLIWQPNLQEEKINERGSKVLRYKLNIKQAAVNKMRQLITDYLPYANLRYIF